MNVRVVKNGLLALPGRDEPIRGDLLIRDGVLAEIGTGWTAAKGAEILDAEGLWVFPGGIDPNVHFGDPGFPRREDFSHGTAAAASGGITTVIDMPSSSVPPVTCLANLREKLAAVKARAHVDYAFFGGLSAEVFAEGAEAAVIAELAPFVRGFKACTVSDRENFSGLGPYELELLFRLAKKAGLPVLLHAEDREYVASAEAAAKEKGKSPFDYYRSRPAIAELLAVQAAALLAGRLKADLHIVHLAHAAGALMLKQFGLTSETCPQYLEFDLGDFMENGSPLKLAPPLKRGQRDQLWACLVDGAIAFATSDHDPAPPEEKRTGSIWKDHAGIPGTDLLWPYLFSEGYKKGRLKLSRFLQVVSENAAKRYGLWEKKGSLEKGKDADLLLVDPEGSFTVEGAKSMSKGKQTPFEGKTLTGRIEQALVRGKTVWDAEEGLLGEAGWGRFLAKEEAL